MLLNMEGFSGTVYYTLWRNEEVDYVQYEKLIDYIITNKLGDSLIVTGTTEKCLLTFERKSQVDGTAIKAGRTNASNCRNWLQVLRNYCADTESRGT